MWGFFRKRRQARRRAFRPTLDGRLETRELLSHAPIHAPAHVQPHAQPQVQPRAQRQAQIHTAAVNPATIHRVPPIRSIQVANGGRALLITDGLGQQFELTVTSQLQGLQTSANTASGTTTPQISAGVVRAHAVPGGRVAITVDGTNSDSILAINPVVKPVVDGAAHQFAFGMAGNTSLLNVASINVTSGLINEIDGYRSADLSGPVTVGGAGFVSRIAFADLLPGASIGVNGNLGSLDILNNAFLSGGPGIQTAGDVDWFSIGQNLILLNGSSFKVGRDVGLIAQGQKGTAPFGAGGQIVGDILIGPGSSFDIGRAINAPGISVLGNFFGFSRVTIGTPTGNGFNTKPGAILVP